MKIAVMILTGLLLTGCAANLPAPGRSYRCPDPAGVSGSGSTSAGVLS